jgi:hypothetical protein
MSASRLSRHNSSGGDDASSVYSGVSVTSSYRHHHTGPFMPPHPASPPQPVLTADAKHVPKTTGSTGIMIVGLGGANGTTLLAGILANRLQLNWHGAKGEPMSSNYYGCITQLDQKGGGVGYRNRVRGLADASMAAVGGWVRIFFLQKSRHSFRTGSLTDHPTTVPALFLFPPFATHRIFDRPNQAMRFCATRSSITIWSDNCNQK